MEILLEYLCTYQNHVNSSYLLTRILPDIVDKGISIENVCSSKIFLMELHFDEWPENSTSKKHLQRAYNGSIFTVRERFNEIFYEPEFTEEIKVIKKKKHPTMMLGSSFSK